MRKSLVECWLNIIERTKPISVAYKTKLSNLKEKLKRKLTISTR